MDDNSEVIVVPNGPDQSWKQSLASFSKDNRVLISPITIANANVARNHGMHLAHGKYLRFLDDDDYFLTDAAEQLRYIERSGADICSGLLNIVTEDGNYNGLVRFPATRDFVAAAASVSGFTLPVGNLFLRSRLAGCQWDPELSHIQDYGWMIDLALKQEWQWIHLERPVGVWFQHEQSRISSNKPLKEKQEKIVGKLTRLYVTLKSTSRINQERREAISAGLWNYIHRGFPYRPVYWSRVAKMALEIYELSGPDVLEFQAGILHNFNPLLAEWLIYPARRITRFYRDLIIGDKLNLDSRGQL
jgi:glycosyltransferase involved in cell wall biosynthesis